MNLKPTRNKPETTLEKQYQPEIHPKPKLKQPQT